MKKSRQGHSSRATKKSKTTEAKDETTANCDIITKDLPDDEDTGFGGWLRSVDGVETMRLFVVANSIVFLTTLAYPHLQSVVEIITEALYGPDSFY